MNNSRKNVDAPAPWFVMISCCPSGEMSMPTHVEPVAESVPNVYILEGGVNNWIDTYAAEEFKLACEVCSENDELRYDFTAALGAQYLASEPNPHDYEIEYVPKVKMELKRAPASGVAAN